MSGGGNGVCVGVGGFVVTGVVVRTEKEEWKTRVMAFAKVPKRTLTIVVKVLGE